MPAFAATDDVLRPYVGYSLVYDDNVLGVADGANTTGEKLSDTARHAEAGIIFNKRISQQVLSGHANLDHITYGHFGQLDNNAKDILANWNWHVGNHVDGNLGVSYIQALTPFVNFHSDELNLRTQRREFFDGAWRLHPSWRLRAGVSRDKLNYDLTSQQAGNRTEVASEVGLDYLASSGSTVGVQLRHTRGDLPNPQLIDTVLVDNSYDQNELKAKVSWLLTGKTQLQFLGGYVQRKHDFFPARDFSGVNARVQASWNATAKLNVTAGIWREIGALDDLTASYTLNQGIGVGSTYDMTSKIRFEGQLKHESSDYSGTVALPSLQLADRKDTFDTASVKMIYRPTTHLQLATTAYHKKRDSSLDGNNAANNGVMLSSRYEF